MSKKGFTLVELLAVIVILAIIAVIATPIILGVIEKAKIGAAEQSAYGYIDAVEKQIVYNQVKENQTQIIDGAYTVEELKDYGVNVKGENPSSDSWIILSKGIVETGTFCVSGYMVSYSDNTSKVVDEKCSEIKSPGNKLSSSVKLGDYISMTPTSTSYTTDTSKTGYTNTQTINPSELNLWRVIKINDDGTIDVVSEYTSSVSIYFQGQTGYKNLVGYLNVIASQYTNTKYVKSTRIMGYNGQTEYLTDTADTVDSTSTTAPWTCSTGGSCNPTESKGGGDTLYETDTNLVQNALGTLVAYKVGITTSSYYWLASRYFYYNSSTRWHYYGRRVSTSGGISNYYYLHYYDSGFYTDSDGNAVRPILTLKSGLQATGSGTSNDPYVLP